VKFVNESILSFHIETYIKEALQKKTHPIPENYSNIRKEDQVIYKEQSLNFGDLFVQETQKLSPEHEENVVHKIPDLEYVGVFSGTYILFQNEEGLYLMDQHAAAERIRYEHYYKALAKPNHAIKHLLIPRDIHLTKEDLSTVESNKNQFKAFGFIVNEMNQIEGLPLWLLDSEMDLAIENMVSMLSEKNRIDLAILRDRLAKDISCKGAIKANKSLSILEINSLLKQLRTCENPYTCPHGRPTLIKLSHYDIERMFKRVV
jgi:DNA mismatch repair protein MutL